MSTGIEKFNPHNEDTHNPLSEIVAAETLLAAQSLSYDRRGVLTISLPKFDDAPQERTQKLHSLAASVASLRDTDPRNIQPIDRENTLRITNPGPGLRLVVESIVTDHEKAGIDFDKSSGTPTSNAKYLVEAIETARADKPKPEMGRGRA